MTTEELIEKLELIQKLKCESSTLFPQLCVIATVVPGKEIGTVGEMGERFLDNQRIEGNISEMLNGAIQFVSSTPSGQK